MVKITSNVEHFLHRVRTLFSPQVSIYLFGSRATGKTHSDSDWDFIIVSSKFEGIDSYHRALKIHHLIKEPFSLDVLCYTPQEFNDLKHEPSLVQECIEQGSLIKIEV